MMGQIREKAETLLQSNMVLWLTAVGGICLHGILCFGQTIWLDEALTGTYIRMGWGELLAFTTTDVHPPLYYLIVKLGITLFGDSVSVVRLFSYLPFVWMVLLTVTKGKKDYGNKAVLLLLVFFFTTPCIIDRNAEMRMYQWGMFFVFGFALYLFSAVRENKNMHWWITCVFGLCAAYTHYYALVTVALLYAVIFFCNWNKRNIVVCILINAGCSVIGYFPWLLVFLDQAKEIKEGGWWQEASFGLKDAYEYLVWPFADRTGFEPYFFLVLFVAAVILAWKKRKAGTVVDSSCSILSLWATGTYLLLLLSGIMIILFYQPVFISRFLYPAVGLLLLGLALVVADLGTEVRLAVCIILVLFSAKTYNSQLHYLYDPDSVPALQEFMDSAKENAVFVCDRDEVKCIVEYLYPERRCIMMSDLNKEDTDGTIYYLFCEENKEESIVDTAEEIKEIDSIVFRYHGFTIYQQL